MDRDCPGLTGEEHPELFNEIPPQPKESKPGQLSLEQVKQFYDEGFLLLEDFFTREELDPCKDAVDQLVDELANKLYAAGKIKNKYSDHGFEDRMTLIEKEFPGASVILHKRVHQPEAIQKLGSTDRILNVMEQLLGSADISGCPGWIIRVKTPKANESTVPWHQDSGYFGTKTYNKKIITGWIPLLDSNEQNGCLQVVRYGHKKGKIAKHVGCWKDTWYVELTDDEMRSTLDVDPEKDIVTCPVPYGGILLFTNFTPHRSLPNTSNVIRWSYDLRWVQADHTPHMRLRSSTVPNYKPDWEAFFTPSKYKQMFDKNFYKDADELDTTNAGAWMLAWPIYNKNRHTEVLKGVTMDQWEGILNAYKM